MTRGIGFMARRGISVGEGLDEEVIDYNSSNIGFACRGELMTSQWGICRATPSGDGGLWRGHWMVEPWYLTLRAARNLDPSLAVVWKLAQPCGNLRTEHSLETSGAPPFRGLR